MGTSMARMRKFLGFVEGLEQLAKGGRMILPVGDAWGFQYLILITKDADGTLHQRKVMPVRFVPMTGQVQQPADDPGRLD